MNRTIAMKTRLTVLLFGAQMLFPLVLADEAPLPSFSTPEILLNPEELSWAPNTDIEHPTLIKVEGLIDNPMGKYYFYYGPHKHIGLGLVYSDHMNGPWTEYKGNPVLEGPAAPDIRWIPEKKKFYLWGHRKNSQTELWTSDDGIDFEYHSVSIQGTNIGTKNATYTRFYEYPIEKYGSRYVMLYVGFEVEKGLRSAWLAHSKDAENWTQLKTPLASPVEAEGENRDIHSAALLRWKEKNYLVYSDNFTWRGGRLRYVELDAELNPVGTGGKRYTLIHPPEEIQVRLRGQEFFFEGDRIHMISGGGKTPRLSVYSSARAK
ncbi:MAG: hypothetical protein AAGF67_10990 [Verrucomicrobiota bacterium]